jgi:c-di-GMP-related signal transduction protein
MVLGQQHPLSRIRLAAAGQARLHQSGRSHLDERHARAASRKDRRNHRAHPDNFTGQFIAEKVETREMFDLCRDSGIQYFQGYYFARPENLANKAIQPGQLAVLDLMHKVRVCEDLGEIEEPLRRNAALTLRLLRYANSAASGLLRQHVHTVRQALVHQTGPYAPFLKLAEASERGDFGKIARYAADIASNPEEVNLAQLQSLAWTEELASEVAPTAEPVTPAAVPR